MVGLASTVVVLVGCSDDGGSGSIEVTITDVSTGRPSTVTATVVVDRTDVDATEDVDEAVVGHTTFEVPAGTYEVTAQLDESTPCPPVETGPLVVDVQGGEDARVDFECMAVSAELADLKEKLTRLGHCEDPARDLLIQQPGANRVGEGWMVNVSCGPLQLREASNEHMLDRLIEQFGSVCPGGSLEDLAFARDGTRLIEGDETTVRAAARAVGLSATRYCDN